MELHPHELKILKALKTKSSPQKVAEDADINIDAVMRASSWLVTKGLVEIKEKIIEEISLGNEGGGYAITGLPERTIVEMIEKEGNTELNISEIQKKAPKEIVSIGLGWLKKKNLAKLEKGKIILLNTDRTEDEKLIKVLRGTETRKLTSDELTKEQTQGLELLRTRQNVIKISEKKRITLIPTSEGIELGESSITVKESQLTPEMLLSGSWKNKEFREYDVNVYVKPKYPAKKHPLQSMIGRIREIFIEMGFEEITGPLVESAFWNFDVLFQPQDHPARDMHDTFYIENLKEMEIHRFDELKGDVKKTHEDGGTTKSTGWGYEWDEDVAKKALLRTHTTAVTARYLSKLNKKDLPKKVFSVGKVFRNESIDYKHLPEFYQVEGIVASEDVTFRNLLGILEEFYTSMGFKVRYRPAYFPYTEMSVEPEVYIEERDEWVELGGAGIFRPEVVIPLLGFDCPVLAWGLGLDRVVALSLGLKDIRELYISDLNWLRKSRPGRLP